MKAPPVRGEGEGEARLGQKRCVRGLRDWRNSYKPKLGLNEAEKAGMLAVVEEILRVYYGTVKYPSSGCLAAFVYPQGRERGELHEKGVAFFFSTVLTQMHLRRKSNRRDSMLPTIPRFYPLTSTRVYGVCWAKQAPPCGQGMFPISARRLGGASWQQPALACYAHLQCAAHGVSSQYTVPRTLYAGLDLLRSGRHSTEMS